MWFIFQKCQVRSRAVEEVGENKFGGGRKVKWEGEISVMGKKEIKSWVILGYKDRKVEDK